MLMSFSALMGSIELGLVYSVLALGIFISFRTLNMPDLTVDGSIVTGMAASGIICFHGGNPFLALIASFIVGGCAGLITGLLHTKLKIQPILAGILVMLASYSINLRIMGKTPNVPLTKSDTVYKIADRAFKGAFGPGLPPRTSGIALGVIILAIIIALLYLFLQTRLGYVFRATGDNEDMVRASGISVDAMKLMGIGLANALVGLAGGLLAQNQSFADINAGVGMLVIGLASVILGEVVFGTSNLLRRLIAAALGAILYRIILAQALYVGMDPIDMKLVSAVIVTIALALGLIGEKGASLTRGRKRAQADEGAGGAAVTGGTAVETAAAGGKEAEA